MQYLGSKNRLSKELLNIVLKDRKEGQTYVEPFVGGANMIDKVEGGNKIASDFDSFLIEMWQALQNGWIPPETLTAEEYKDIKENRFNGKYEKALVTFVGYLCSFGGKWFGGYAKNSKGDNYCGRAKRVLLKQIKTLKDVNFSCCSYEDLVLEPNSIIYCDPPYANTTKYKYAFDSIKFWDWVRLKTKEGHNVFVSEYNAPDDFKCIWQKEVKVVLNKNSQDIKRIEKLFVYEETK